MIKDKFIFNKNSYNVKLMKFTWGLNYYDFSHTCPYFWLSVFNHLFIIPILFVKGVVKLGKLIWKLFGYIADFFNFLGDKISEKQQNWYYTYYRRIKTNPEEQQKFICLDFSKKCNRKYSTWINDSYNYGSYGMSEADDYDFLSWLYEQRNMSQNRRLTYERNQESISRAASIKRKDKINKLLKIIKPITRVLLWIISGTIVIVVTYLAFKGLIGLIHWFSTWKFNSMGWKKFFHVLGQIGLVAILLSVAAAIILLIIAGLKKLFCNFNCNKQMRIIGIPFVFILRIFSKIAKTIYHLILLIIEIIKNNCPAIEWTD